MDRHAAMAAFRLDREYEARTDGDGHGRGDGKNQMFLISPGDDDDGDDEDYGDEKGVNPRFASFELNRFTLDAKPDNADVPDSDAHNPFQPTSSPVSIPRPANDVDTSAASSLTSTIAEVPTFAPTSAHPDLLHTTKGTFTDRHGRQILLRGVNFSGSSKHPYSLPSHASPAQFWSTAENDEISFVGRPLDLQDGSADAHLARLKGWGFNYLRYCVTWEALEHAGPGEYDTEFIEYTIEVLRKCKDYGFRVFIDPHQDVWSRFSGGSGAPYWTLLAAGLNPRNFSATQGALLHNEWVDPTASASTCDPSTFPSMIWSTNYTRLVSQTLFTLFFAGSVYAPRATINGTNIQHFLQSHYINAFGVLADAIAAADGGALLECTVIGWDSMNEPSEGFVGWEDLRKFPDGFSNALSKGTRPTPAQSFRLGCGVAQDVDWYEVGSFGPRKAGSVRIDPRGRSIWADPSTEPGGVHPRFGWQRGESWKLGECLWAQHGVWDPLSTTKEVLKPRYFSTPTHTTFVQTFWRDHFLAYTTRIRAAHPMAIAFIQPPVFQTPPCLPELFKWSGNGEGRACYAPHYYDGLTLITRHWNWFNADALGLMRGSYTSRFEILAKLQALKLGSKAIRKSIAHQLRTLTSDTNMICINQSYPTLIGEIGVPFDMDARRAYRRGGLRGEGDYTAQTKALDASLAACDGGRCIGYTVWNYCPENGHVWGDGWDGEDLSVWSRDDVRRRQQNQQYRQQQQPNPDGAKMGARKRGASIAVATLNRITSRTRSRAGSNAEREREQEKNNAGFVSNALASQLSLVSLSPATASPSAVNSSANLLAHGNTERKRTNMTYPPKPSITISRFRSNSNANSNSNSSAMDREWEQERDEKAYFVSSDLASQVSLATLGLPSTGTGATGNEGLLRVPTPIDEGSESRERESSLNRLRVNTRLNSSMTLLPSSASALASNPSTTSASLHASALKSPAPRSPLATPSSYVNPYAFLVDGARALPAFCRPYPLATVGRLKEVKFDPGRAVWKMAVAVSATSLLTGTSGDGEKREDVPTELFVPLVHFASERVVRDARIAALREGYADSDPEDGRDVDVDVEAEGCSGLITSQPSEKPHPNNAFPFSRRGDGLSTIPPSSYALSITVSHGRYSLTEDQKVLWYYHLPSAEEGEVEYNIEFRRAGGPIAHQGANLKSSTDRCWEMLEGVGAEGKSICCC